MNTSFKSFDELPKEAMFIRETVFIKEQGFNDEFDENDKNSVHILMFENDIAIGTARIIYSNEHRCYMIGRFAILKEYRNRGLGRKLMQFTEQEIVKRFSHILIVVSSQEQASKFYEKVGFSFTNERYLDQHCPHVFMIKKL